MGSSLQLVLAAVSAAHVLQGGHEVVGFQGRSGDFLVGVFWFTVAPKDDDASRLETFSHQVALEVFGFHALGHFLHALVDLVGIQEGPIAHAVGDLAVPKSTVEIEVFIAV